MELPKCLKGEEFCPCGIEDIENYVCSYCENFNGALVPENLIYLWDLFTEPFGRIRKNTDITFTVKLKEREKCSFYDFIKFSVYETRKMNEIEIGYVFFMHFFNMVYRYQY